MANINSAQQDKIDEAILRAFDSVLAQFNEPADHREYKGKPVNTLQIVKKDLKALPNKTPDEERILSLGLPIEKLTPEDSEKFMEMLKRAKLETSQCYKYVLETQALCRVSQNKDSF